MRKRRVARGSRTVGRRSGRARGADGGQFSPAAKKGNFFFLWWRLVWREDGGMRRRLHLLMDSFLVKFFFFPSGELTDGRAANLFLSPGPCKTAALRDAYRFAGVCKKAGQGQQSNKCRRVSFWIGRPLVFKFLSFETAEAVGMRATGVESAGPRPLVRCAREKSFFSYRVKEWN